MSKNDARDAKALAMPLRHGMTNTTEVAVRLARGRRHPVGGETLETVGSAPRG